MKKLLIGTLAVVLVLTAITAGALAAGRGQGSRFAGADWDGLCGSCTAGTRGTGCGLGFVDADNDGVCDNYTAGTRGTGCGWGHGGHHGGRHG